MKYRVTLLLLVLSLPVIYGQQREIVDFKILKGTVSFLPENKTVKGELSYTFEMKEDADSIFIDGKNMTVSLSSKSPLKAELKARDKKIWVVQNLEAGKAYTLQFSYQITAPKKALYFVGWDTSGKNQIWSQGQGKHNSYWLPSPDDKNEKVKFDLTYKVPAGYTAVGNGRMVKHRSEKSQEIWRYKMKHPMSSYLVAVAVGDYQKKTLTSATGTPILLYYQSRFADKVEPTYRYSKKILDFLEKEIGVSYPWQNYKQVPVRDFLYAGMENTTTTIFSESFMTDSTGFIDRNYVNVNAHELAHQWFGDLVTEQSSESHWLQEGFATYYALLAEREIFGEDYFYHKLFKSAEKLKAQSDLGKGEALNDPKASSLTFYQKGAWALYVLRHKIGDEAFKKGIKSYLRKYQYSNVTLSDFIEEVEKSSGKDLSEFVSNWLKQTAFQAEEALGLLEESSFLKKFMKIKALRKQSLDDKYDQFNEALFFPVNRFIGQEVVHQLAGEKPSLERQKLYEKAFKTNDILIRQAISNSLKQIPEALQEDYESLLQDKSYLTQEQSLFNLWNAFPEKRRKYLNALKDARGFYDKNVRMLWLTLSLVTDDYHPEKNQSFYKELAGYTSPTYDYAVRQNAFGHLYQINVFNERNYVDLMQACVHPVWQFRKFSRKLLDKLLEEKDHRNKLKGIKSELPEKEQKILKKALTKTEG